MDTNQMTEKAEGAANQLKQTAQDWSQKAKRTARDAGAAADLYVHEYAWTTMLSVALFAGFLGFIIGRSTD